MKIVPLIPAHLRTLAGALGAVILAGALFAPEPWRYYLAAVGAVALYLAGLGWRLPAWAAGRPLVPLALVPLLLTGAALLERLLPTLPESVQGWGALALGVLSLLAGRMTPEPVTVEGKPSALPALGPVTVQVDTGCSLADAARGLCVITK